MKLKTPETKSIVRFLHQFFTQLSR